MAYAFIHGEVKGSGASVEFKGNGIDLLDLTVQIVGSVVAEVPQPLRPYIIRASVAAMNASIKAIELKFGTNVTKNPFSATFGSLDGLTVTGVWNADQARVEF